jgi:hypothetical protein
MVIWWECYELLLALVFLRGFIENFGNMDEITFDF